PPLWESRVGLLLKGQLVKIVIDGIDADRTYQYYQPLTDASGGEGLQERYQFLKNILDEFTAEDILGIEVIYSAQYNSKYNQRLLSKDEMIFTDRSGKLSGVGGASGIDYAYLEITTRNGKGPFIKKTPGVYLYRPLPFTFPKKFYRPR